MKRRKDHRSQKQQQTGHRAARSYWFVLIALTMATLGIFMQVKDFGFIDFDDAAYVTDNVHVRGGLGIKGIAWAFTSGYQGNWHPLTWMSHMLDCQVFGLDAGGHHVVSVGLHLVNALLLFILLEQMSGAIWRSGLVAALFAVHPLHVESVAWVAERKDVLSALFWLLTTGSYVWYVRRPSLGRYGLTMLLFAMGLMAKPMAVTLPFALLLLDIWPLQRAGAGARQDAAVGQGRAAAPGGQTSGTVWLRLMMEKVPLMALSAAVCVATLMAQRRAGACVALDVIPFSTRCANALASYVLYLAKTLAPLNLAVFYPHPRFIPGWQAALAALALIVATGTAFAVRKRWPYVLTGWLWYVGTLVPVIGLVQVGTQAMADRYTYLPLIGIFMIVAWGGHEAATKLRLKSSVLAAAACCALLVLAGMSRVQVSYWKDSITLFEHAAAATKNNFLAHSKAGFNLLQQGRLNEALPHHAAARRIKPRDAEAYNNLGVTLFRLGRFDEAVRTFREALQYDGGSAELYYNLGLTLGALGDTQEALRCYRQALQLKPDYPEAHNNLGRLLASLEQVDEACAHLREAVRLQPDYAEA